MTGGGQKSDQVAQILVANDYMAKRAANSLLDLYNATRSVARAKTDRIKRQNFAPASGPARATAVAWHETDPHPPAAMRRRVSHLYRGLTVDR